MNESEAITEVPLSFEDFRQENGSPYWWASDLMAMVGYKNMGGFNKVVARAIKACLTLGISQYDNFTPVNREVKGEKIQDFKLTRFGCYLAVMNGDPGMPAVAKAQMYFVETTRKFELDVQGSEDFDRLGIRDEIKQGHTALNSAAKSAGVQDYARFMNAGYRGMYNMLNVDLARRRGVDSKSLFDHMGRIELAANLFRITQTEARITTRNVKGQLELEKTHFDVGREVRDMTTDNSGVPPEQLPMSRELPDIQRELKRGARKMLKADSTEKSKKEKPADPK